MATRDPLDIAADIMRSDELRDSASWGTAAHAQALATIAIARDLRLIRVLSEAKDD